MERQKEASHRKRYNISAKMHFHGVLKEGMEFLDVFRDSIIMPHNVRPTHLISSVIFEGLFPNYLSGSS